MTTRFCDTLYNQDVIMTKEEILCRIDKYRKQKENNIVTLKWENFKYNKEQAN